MLVFLEFQIDHKVLLNSVGKVTRVWSNYHPYAMLCYAILCYVMLCYAMLCYAMLCYAMLCYAMLCYAMLCYAMLCYAMLCYAILYYTILYYTILYYTILYYTILYYTILYYTILYYTILCTDSKYIAINTSDQIYSGSQYTCIIVPTGIRFWYRSQRPQQWPLRLSDYIFMF